MAAAARELNLYESQLYNWRSKQQISTLQTREQRCPAEIARLKRQLVVRGAAIILQKAATYCEAPEMKYAHRKTS